MRRLEVLVLVGMSIFVTIILALSSQPIYPGEWGRLLALFVLLAVSAKVELTSMSTGSLDMTGAGLFAAFLIYGPHLTVWVVTIFLLAEGLLFGQNLINILYNVTGLTVASFLSFQVYALLGGAWGPGFNHLLEATISASVLMLLNPALVALFLHAQGRLPFWSALKGMLDPSAVRAYAITMMVGILAAFAYTRGGFLWAGGVVVLALLLSTTLRSYFIIVTEARDRSQQLETVLNATQGALIMIDRGGAVRVANRQAGQLFDVNPDEIVGLQAAEIPGLGEVQQRMQPDENQVLQVLEMTRGPARYVHWYRAAVSDQQDQPQGHIDVFTDVTPLKEAEQNQARLYDSMINALTAAIDARDSYTHGHSARVSAYSVAIAREMGLGSADLERIRYAGLLHDIGKLGIDDRVLRKHGSLTPSERALMMQHPAIGAEVLERANVLTDLIPGVRWHHEWYSGGGYPDGLSAAELPLDPRIIAVADALDAMTSDRPYRPAMSLAEAIRRITAGAGVQFDPDAAAAAVVALESGRLVITGLHDQSKPPAVAPEEGIIRPVHGKELSIFYRLSREDYSSLDMSAMLQRFLETVAETLGPNIYLVYLCQPDSTLTLGSAFGMEGAGTEVDKDLRLVREALATAKSVAMGNTLKLENYRPAGPNAKSEVVVPLGSSDSMLGALVVEAALPEAFTRDDVYLLEAIGQRLTGAIRLVRYHEQLAVAATHDGLTGVFNHRYFYERLTEEVGRAQRYERLVSLVLLDLNGLKALNDTYGHLAGDEALREYGRILKSRVRVGDVVARYGGDEFAIIMPEIGHSEATRAAVRLLNDLQTTFEFGGLRIPLPSAAWGVAAFPADGTRATELVAEADKAMYREKRHVSRRASVARQIIGD